MKKNCFYFLLLFAVQLYATDIVPGAPQKTPIAIVGGTVYTISGDVIADGIVVFDKGVITAVGKKDEVQLPNDTVVIDAKGKNVYPGLIAPSTTTGLIEIEAVRATNDTAEVGSVNPNVEAYTAYNTDSEIIPTVRSNGILTAHIVPQGRGLTGTSALMMLDGWSAEDAVLVKQVGVHLDWPSMTVIEAWWMTTSATDQQKNIKKNLQAIEDTFEDVKRYKKLQEHDADMRKDIRWEAMLPVLDRKVPLFIHASEYKQIEAAVEFCRKNNLWMILVGGADSWKLTHLLKKNNVSVILQKVNSLPNRDDEDYDLAYRLPKLLHDAGVSFCFSEDSSWDVRNLPFQAGTAIAYGLDKRIALRSITLSAAEILGVAKRLGSLEIGKDATIIISKGDVMDIRTNHIEHAFIQGKKVDLDDRHKRLWRKYQQKYK